MGLQQTALTVYQSIQVKHCLTDSELYIALCVFMSGFVDIVLDTL